MPVTGSGFTKLDEWTEKLREMGGEPALLKLNRGLADETIRLIDRGFATRSDPYGKAWAQHVIPTGGQILERTGGLRAAFIRSGVTASGFKVKNRKPYFAFMQKGTGIYGKSGTPIVPNKARALAFEAGGQTFFAQSVRGSVARRMMPQPASKIPSAWRKAYVRVAQKLWFSALKRGAR